MKYESNYLTHYGIKGQRWGQRRFQEEDGTYTAAGRERYRKSSGKTGFVSKTDPKVNKTRPGLDLPKNKKPTVLDKLDEWRDRSVMKDGVSKGLSGSNSGQSAKRTRHEKAVRDLDEVLDSKDPKVRDAYSDKDRKELLDYRNKLASKDNLPLRTKGLSGGLKTNGVYDREDGTKDMKRLQKDAKKDAEDMARAKAYYGEGAGNRRKQIRNRISERMKDQKAANRERKVQDAKNSAARVGQGLKNILLGVGSTSLTAIAIYNVAKLTGADKKIAEFGKKAVNDIIRKAKSLKKPSVKDYNWQSDKSSYTVPKSSYTVPKSSYTVPDSAYKNRSWIDKDGVIHVK